MEQWLITLIKTPARHHLWGSLTIVVLAAVAISTQISDRRGFANSELYRDVMDRWGTPIVQPAPSVRYVESGTVFTSLKPLVLTRQSITIDAEMNYRKRGLVYFSGFDFVFAGGYEVANPETRDIDVVFVFPVALDRNRVLLSELRFAVNGEPAGAELSAAGDKIVWTGRLAGGEHATFDVHFKGRGLDELTYRLDPTLPVRDFSLAMQVRGGDNYDYPAGVVPAQQVEQSDEIIALRWSYPALESGVPVGAVLPSERSFDALIATMAQRSWAPFLLLFVALSALAAAHNKRLRFFEAYLIAAAYGFFFVLVAYFAAFMNFYLGYALAAAIIIALLSGYTGRLIARHAAPKVAALLVACLVIPTVAVIAEGYTGLIYALEILTTLAAAMYLSTRDDFHSLVDKMTATTEAHHDA